MKKAKKLHYDATFLECLVNDVGSPDDSLRRPFPAGTPATPEKAVSDTLISTPAPKRSKKRVTFALSNASASKAKASSMPELLESPVPAASRVRAERPKSKPRARNSFVFSAFSKMSFSSTKRSASCVEIASPTVDRQ
ncbi:hypothetical protein MRX96_005075 [Rhipicephalus microplus]